MTNPFKQPNNIWKIELVTYYFMLPIFEEYFANFTDNISCYELSSNTVESEDNDIWCFEAYLEENINLKKAKEDLNKIISELSLSWEHEDELKITLLEDIDWVKKVQESFVPINLGSFFITNPSSADLCPNDMEKIIIDASGAFGTGEHCTTQGCIEAMELLKNENFLNIADIGTGSGILAIVAAKIWNDASIIACDIEEISVKIAKHHAAINNVSITSVLADGVNALDSLGLGSKKIDLIISNILAMPLINMASDFKNIISNNGFLILSGFLDYQLPQVIDAYIKHSFTPIHIKNKKSWITLVMQEQEDRKL